jgi:penicillin-binding protein 2
VAYAPAEHPRIALAVLVEHGQHGSSAAAPVARELVAAYLGSAAEDMVVVAAGGEADSSGNDE